MYIIIIISLCPFQPSEIVVFIAKTGRDIVRSYDIKEVYNFYHTISDQRKFDQGETFVIKCTMKHKLSMLNP